MSISPFLSITVNPLDILFIKGCFQRNYRHQILSSNYHCGPRINLTFRTIINHDTSCPQSEQQLFFKLKISESKYIITLKKNYNLVLNLSLKRLVRARLA